MISDNSVLITVMSKKRNYYKPFVDGSSGRYKMFLVRYHDSKENSYLCDGPFKEQEEALETVSEYLRNGICSWMVTYND